MVAEMLPSPRVERRIDRRHRLCHRWPVGIRQIHLDVHQPSTLQTLNVAQMGAVAAREPSVSSFVTVTSYDVLALPLRVDAGGPFWMPPILLSVSAQALREFPRYARAATAPRVSRWPRCLRIEGIGSRERNQCARSRLAWIDRWGTWAQVGGNWIAAQQLVDPRRRVSGWSDGLTIHNRLDVEDGVRVRGIPQRRCVSRTSTMRRRASTTYAASRSISMRSALLRCRDTAAKA